MTNTPWGERHAYVIGAGAGRIIEGGMDKALHVSPFMEMDQRYEVRATDPAATLSVHIASHQRGERAFDATLALRRRELTARTLAETTVRHPASTLRTLALIYGHALALWLRRRPRTSPIRGAHDRARRTPSRAGAAAADPRGPPDDRRGTARRTVIGEGAPQATVVVRSPRMWPALLRGGRDWPSPTCRAVGHARPRPP